MEDNFNMRKIHAGYVVEFRNGERGFAMRYDNGNAGDNLVFLNTDTDCFYGPANHWDSKTLLRTGELLCRKRADLDIVAVYGYVRRAPVRLTPLAFRRLLLSSDTKSREELWRRREAVKMTLAQVCEKLGYDVEIVKEAPEDGE